MKYSPFVSSSNTEQPHLRNYFLYLPEFKLAVEQLKEPNFGYVLPVFTAIHLPDAAGIGKRGRGKADEKRAGGTKGRSHERERRKTFKLS